MGRPRRCDHHRAEGQCRHVAGEGVMSAPKIPDSPEGERVREVFAKFGCDPANPDHWFALLYCYIKASRRPAGRPHTWTATQLFQLIIDVDEMRWREETRLKKAGLEG